MRSPSAPTNLTVETYRRGISELAARDRHLARLLSKWGDPPYWTHPPGFPGIVISILAQQVSLESAQAAFTKLEVAIGSVTPERFLSLGDSELRAVGFSRQKASYVRALAHGLVAGTVDLDSLELMDDDDARESLMQLRGVGPWTADAYLLFALLRADAWPSGDLALAKAIQEVRGLAATPSPHEADTIAKRWRPWRAVAARMLWHHYLCKRGRSASD
jgi:DNA-3-methyladenine glycosylase II